MADPLSDADLVRQFRDGDALAFERVVRRFQDRLFRLASLWLYDAGQAEDATQEVFLRAYKGLRSFRFRGEPFTWLYRTLRNVCHEFNRRRRTETLDTEPPDAALHGADALARHNAFREARRWVDDLPDRQREVVILRIFEECSVRETAAAMRCREGTVKALLHKAMQRMKRRAGDAGSPGV